MAFCQVCRKTKQYGHNVSHSKRRTKRVFMPNVFGKRMLIESQKLNGEIRRIKICAKCLKRVKKFGEVKAKDEAVLRGMLVKVVDWQGIAKSKVLARKQAEAASKLEGKKKTEVKEIEKERAEVSIEELVGRKKQAESK